MRLFIFLTTAFLMIETASAANEWSSSVDCSVIPHTVDGRMGDVTNVKIAGKIDAATGADLSRGATTLDLGNGYRLEIGFNLMGAAKLDYPSLRMMAILSKEHAGQRQIGAYHFFEDKGVHSFQLGYLDIDEIIHRLKLGETSLATETVILYNLVAKNVALATIGSLDEYAAFRAGKLPATEISYVSVFCVTFRP